MRVLRIIAAISLSALAFAASAEPITLRPADPQPEAAALAPGLAVYYAYPPEVGSLREAADWLERGAEPGPPLSGLRYRDTLEGEPTLTSRQATRVAAAISGYVRLERAGPMKVEFFSNDGLLVTLGGSVISKHDGRHPCESNGYHDVVVPEPGWYEIDLVYFQRLGTACLMMKWDGQSEKLGWAPDDIFARRAD